MKMQLEKEGKLGRAHLSRSKRKVGLFPFFKINLKQNFRRGDEVRAVYNASLRGFGVLLTCAGSRHKCPKL